MTNQTSETTLDNTAVRNPSAIDAVADSFTESLLEMNPSLATSLGIPGHETEYPDYSPAGAEALAECTREALRRLEDLEPTDDVDRVTLDAMRERLGLERMRQQILEAAEQCERFIVPELTPPRPLTDILSGLGDLKLLACLERDKEARLLGAAISVVPGDIGFLIGPEGGFTAEENVLIRATSCVIPVSLGETVLRCETASTMTLAVLKVIRDL